MTHLPPSGTGRRALAILVAGALATGALAGCAWSPAPPSTSPTVRVGMASTPLGSAGAPVAFPSLVLIGTPGAMRLASLDGDTETRLPLPEGDVRWTAGDPSRGLVATIGPTGRIYLSGPIDAGVGPTWREVRVDDAARRWLGQSLADAVVDAERQAIVAVAADPAAGREDGRLVILDPSGGSTHLMTLKGRWDGRAPAWIGSDRVAVSTRDTADETALTIVDLAGGASRRWGSAIGAFAVSGDGATIAYQDRNDGRILVGPFDPVRDAGAFAELASAGRPRVAAQLLLDATGRRLAVAWLDDAGDTTALAVYERAVDQWSLVRTGPVPRGVSRVVLVSLGP